MLIVGVGWVEEHVAVNLLDQEYLIDCGNYFMIADQYTIEDIEGLL